MAKILRFEWDWLILSDIILKDRSSILKYGLGLTRLLLSIPNLQILPFPPEILFKPAPCGSQLMLNRNSEKRQNHQKSQREKECKLRRARLFGSRIVKKNFPDRLWSFLTWNNPWLFHHVAYAQKPPAGDLPHGGRTHTHRKLTQTPVSIYDVVTSRGPNVKFYIHDLNFRFSRLANILWLALSNSPEFLPWSANS